MPNSRKYGSKRRKGHTPKSRLPFFLIAGGVLILLTAAFFAFQNRPSSAPPEVTGRPNLSVDKQAVDLGEVKLGTPVEVSFRLENTGDKILRFSRAPFVEVKEGC